MLRYYFRSSDLDDLEAMESELERDGFPRRHIHVLSDDQVGLERHHLNPVPSIFRSDGVHWAERGALLGLLVSSILVLALMWSGAPEVVGWVTIMLLAALVLGAFTWEAGLIGMQRINYKFEGFKDSLRRGEHVMLVDVDESEVYQLHRHMEDHPGLALIGRGSSMVNPFAAHERAL